MSIGTVLVVEDDAAIRRGLCDALEFAGYRILQASDGLAGLEAALGAQIDLLLLDLLMPRMDGFTVLGEVRRVRPTLPVIILTARGETEDRVRGLRLGADDYVVKPFNAAELLARVEAVLRRSAERPRPVEKFEIAGRSIDLARREATLPDGRRVQLSERESELLAYLVANPGRAVSRDELLSRVWRVDPRGVQTRTVDMAVARLRELLADDPGSPSIIITVRAKGYMLASPVSAGANDPATGSRDRSGGVPGGPS